MQLVFVERRVAHHFQSHIVETLQGADTRGADGDGTALMIDELLDGVATHANVFGMHLMTFDLLALHRLEGAGTDMKGEFFALDTMGIEIG